MFPYSPQRHHSIDTVTSNITSLYGQLLIMILQCILISLCDALMHYTKSADKLSCCFSMFIEMFMMWNVSEAANSCVAVYSSFVVILDLIIRYKNHLRLKKKANMFLWIIYLTTCLCRILSIFFLLIHMKIKVNFLQLKVRTQK